MIKLFQSYIFRVAKWPVFWILMAVGMAGGLIAGIFTPKYAGLLLSLPFMLSGILFPHYVGLFIALFNYPQFTGGTIRNQIGVGHKRSSILFTDWFSSNLISLGLYLSFTGALYLSAAIVGGLTDVSGKAVFWAVLISSLQIIFYTTSALLYCVVLKGILSFLAVYFINQIIACAGFLISLKKASWGFWTQLLPSASVMDMNVYEPVEKGWIIALVSLALVVVVYMISQIYFKKADLK
ncbi:MAG: hypothetical protein J5825_07810 [Lachnospiraceae bacterium]|nr:hypothetical protein [Lachnospiraceae bacterium]